MSSARSISRLLLDCAREHDWTRPPPGLAEAIWGKDLKPLAPAANAHGVAGCAYRSLLGLESVDPGVMAHLEVHSQEAMARHLNVLSDLAGIKPVLDAAVGRWLVVKGPVLAEVLYPFADLRSYADLDVVVPQEEFGSAVAALEDAGATILDRNWRLIRREMRGQLHLVLPRGTVCDLHWNLVNTDRGPFRISVAEMIERRRTVDVGGVSVGTLDAEDTLLHLALHACMAGGDRIVWVKDVDLAARASRDWDTIINRAEAWRVAPLVWKMLARAEAWLSTPLPDEAWRLRGTSSPLSRAFERISRPADPQRLSLARLSARTAGRDLRWVSATGARHVFRTVFGRDALHPSGVLKELGDAGDRAAFLEEVSRRKR